MKNLAEGLLDSVNLAGLDFGSDIWATAPAFPHDYLAPPMDQIQHFCMYLQQIFAIALADIPYPPTASQGVNVFRIPFREFRAVCYSGKISAKLSLPAPVWEYMEPNGPGTGLDSSFFGMYDSYVQQALSQGAYVIVDPHK